MERKWWKEGIIYQIYPQSFYDSNGDGIGDIQGIISKLDYVKSLGVDIIWLNPIYDSPLDDNGYDIRDYRKLNPIYGSMEDFEELLENVHYRGMRLIMDLVVNHSSDEHEWFVNSRKSKDNPYRDYYFWRPGKNGGPPNNWISVFSGSAWEFDELTDEYYLHLFTKKQPDLNWENPRVRNEIYNLVNWWLDKGIDGFRLDVISMISKETHFPDAETEHFEEMMTWYYCNGPRVHEFIHEMHERTFKHYNIMTVGEGPGITKDIGNLYTGKDRGELDMIFPLDLMFADWGPGGKYDFGTLDLRRVKQYFSEWAEELGDNGWMSIFLDNHDFARMVSRFGDDGMYREASAKCLLTMIMTLRGTPSIHYGSEIGMTNVAFDSIEEYKDVEALNFYREAVSGGMPPEEALRRVQVAGRDNVRTPMQWNQAPNAGFSEGTPWLKVNPNFTEINVESAEENVSSILHFFRQLVSFRKDNLTLIYGSFEDLSPERDDIFHYQRKGEDRTLVILLNFTSVSLREVPLPEPYQILLTNYGTAHNVAELRPWEAIIYEV